MVIIIIIVVIIIIIIIITIVIISVIIRNERLIWDRFHSHSFSEIIKIRTGVVNFC